MLIIDGHCDIPQDLELGFSLVEGNDVGPCGRYYSIPQWKAGRVALQICAITTHPYTLDMRLKDLRLERVALERALVMVELLRREIDRQGDDLFLVTTAGQIERLGEGRTGLLVGLEGADPIGTNLELIHVLHRMGVRYLGLSWNNRNPLADGKKAGRHPGGLTTLGEEAVQLANRLGILLDVAHLSDTGMRQAVELSTKPVVLSHTSITMNLARREMLQIIAEAGGLIGVIFYGMRDLAAIRDEVIEFVNCVGEEHVCLGSDLFGPPHSNPTEVDIGSLPLLADALRSKGLSSRGVDRIMGENYKRLLVDVLS